MCTKGDEQKPTDGRLYESEEQGSVSFKTQFILIP